MESSSADLLIQPECLSVDHLKQILLQRGVLTKDLPQDRGGIVNLYNRLILPLPQRETIKSLRLSKTLRSSSSSNNSSNINGRSPDKSQTAAAAESSSNKTYYNVKPTGMSDPLSSSSPRRNFKTKAEPSASTIDSPAAKRAKKSAITWP